MKLTAFPFNGTTYYLLLNGAALFNIYDQYGSEGSVFDPIRGGGSEGFAAVCWYLAADRAGGTVPAAAGARQAEHPHDGGLRRGAVAAGCAPGQGGYPGRHPRRVLPGGGGGAARGGCGALGIGKKNGTRLTRAKYLNMAAQFLGLSPFEAMLLPVGLVMDMEDLELRRRGLRKEKAGA